MSGTGSRETKVGPKWPPCVLVKPQSLLKAFNDSDHVHARVLLVEANIMQQSIVKILPMFYYPASFKFIASYCTQKSNQQKSTA